MSEFLKAVKGGAKALFFKVIGYAVVGLIIVVGLSVYHFVKSGESIIDNPTSEVITFKIDDKEYSLQPKTSQKIKLSKGEHTLEYSGGVTTFTKKASDFLDSDYSVVNPTRSFYVLSNEIYVYGNSLSDQEIEKKVAIYDCEDAEGNPDKCDWKVLSGVFIQEKVHYGLDEEFPDTVELSKKARYTLKTKLFREQDFYKEEDEEVEGE